jgi:hypothetical protein
MKRSLLLAVAILFAILLPTTANAHALIMDTSKTVGLVLHISPADEPVLGEQSTLYFDIQDIAAPSKRTASLTISSEADKVVTLPVVSQDNSLSASYTFTKAGIYTLKLSVVQPNKTYVFEHVQRIGDSTTHLSSAQSKEWAKLGLTVAASLLAILIIVAINRRALIATQSK